MLKPLTQKVAIARDEGRLAEEAVLKAKSAVRTPNREEESLLKGCCWSRRRLNVRRRT